MNGKLIAAFVLISQISYAQMPVGKIENLNANYRSPAGTGKVAYLNIEDFGEYKNANLEVENYNGLLQFMIEDKQFELDLSMLGISDAEEINFSTLNFQNSDSSIGLNVASGMAKDQEKDFNLSFSSASITCQKAQTYEDIKTELLANCLNNANISLGKLDFQKQELTLQSFVQDNLEIQGGFDLSNFKVNIASGKYKAETKSSVSSGMTIKLEGLTNYNIDEKIIEIKIDKAKAGIFSIKSKIFDELRKIESESITVNEPFIYITLED